MKFKLLVILCFLSFAFAAKGQSKGFYGKVTFSRFAHEASAMHIVGAELRSEKRISFTPRIGIGQTHFKEIPYGNNVVLHRYIGSELGAKLKFKNKYDKAAVGIDFSTFVGLQYGGNSNKQEFSFAPTLFISGITIFEHIEVGINFGGIYSKQQARYKARGVAHWNGLGFTGGIFLTYIL